MRVLLIVAALFTATLAADYYPGRVDRNAGPYATACGGISTLSTSRSVMNNPALGGENDMYFAFTLGEFSREYYQMSSSSRLKKSLFLNGAYNYTVVRHITLYNADEAAFVESYTSSHLTTLGLKYELLTAQKTGTLAIGAAANIYSEHMGENIATDNILNGFNIGADYIYDNIEVALTLDNIASKKDWATTVDEDIATLQKEISTEAVPIVGSVAGKYTYNNMISVLAEVNIEDVEDLSYNAIFRSGLIIKVPVVDIYAGYGDEKASLGIGYAKKFRIMSWSLIGAIETAKQDDINFSVGTGLFF